MAVDYKELLILFDFILSLRPKNSVSTEAVEVSKAQIRNPKL